VQAPQKNYTLLPLTCLVSVLILILEPSIHLLLKENWLDIVLPCQIALIAGVYMVAGYVNGTYFLTTGQQSIRQSFTLIRTGASLLVFFICSSSVIMLVSGLAIRAMIIETAQIIFARRQLSHVGCVDLIKMISPAFLLVSVIYFI
jgi:hypothetical protein